MKRHSLDSSINFHRRTFLGQAGIGSAMIGLSGLMKGTNAAAATQPDQASGATPAALLHSTKFIAADPTDLPKPIHRSHPVHHDITLVAQEVRAKLADGNEFDFMTWNGQVPGPMIRVRQGDTLTVTVRSDPSNTQPHNVDMHAIFGSGGGAAATMVAPGQSRKEFFKCMYPGAFIYHCAVSDMDLHISCGMFGMIVVEPEHGLPHVDREFYLGQHEIYTREPFGHQGLLHFDNDAMVREQPQFVVFNGAVGVFTGAHGLKARVGETVRVFMVSGGPNLSSSFHPIGNVWKRAWPQGALANPPLQYVQTQPVPPGSCFIGEMELPVAETIKLVDHALTRVTQQGLLVEIDVQGAANPGIFHPIA